jgi:hypothetical protein
MDIFTDIGFGHRFGHWWLPSEAMHRTGTLFLRVLKKPKQRLEAEIEREQVLVARLPKLSVDLLKLAAEVGRLRVTGRHPRLFSRSSILGRAAGTPLSHSA